MVNEWTRDEWKARAEVAEQYAQAVSDSNRDNADRASKAERERDEAREQSRAASIGWMNAADRAEAAERQRDELQERADQLRDERDDAVQSCITVGRDRDEWKARAEAVVARTATAARREGQAEANSALAERVADYADATYDLIDSPNGARLAFEYIVAMIRGEVNL